MVRCGRPRLTSVSNAAARIARSLLMMAALVAAASAAAPPALALDPHRSIKQYKHTRWTASEGAPSGITRITQTPDGFLWLAAYEGLFRFDGVNFERMDPDLDQAQEGAPWHVATDLKGEVWAWYPASKRIRVYDRGRLRTIAAPEPEGTLVDLAYTPDGDIWIAGGRVGQPMLRYHAGRWSKVQPSEGYGRDTNMGMVVAADGALWVAYSNNVFRRFPGTSRFERMINDPGARMRLSLDRDGRVWVTGASGARPITEPGGRWTGREPSFRYPSDNHSRRGWSLFDRDGNLWVARRKYGVERLRRPDPRGPDGPVDPPEEFRATDGLTSDSVYTIFEDREGSIWVGTTVGLDRFRDADVISELGLKEPAAFGDILFADSRGNVFIGQRNTVYKVEPGGVPRPVLKDVNEPEAICEGPNGSIWIALADQIVVLRGGRSRIPKPKGLENPIKDCGLDRWGRFWFSAEASGLYLRTVSGWRHVPTSSSVPFSPGQMVRDNMGDLWVNGGRHSLARIDSAGPTLLRYPKNGLKEVRTMAPYGDGLLLAGLDGVALLRRGRLSVIAADRLVTLLHVNGIVRTPGEETWILSKAGLNRVRTADIYRALEDSRFRVPVRTLGFLDGLADSNSVRTPRAMVRGGDGRLWAATATGIVRVNPARLTFNPLPPKIAIRWVEAGGRRYVDQSRIKLPAGSSNLTFGFAALSLRMPERVRVRYRLEGQDEGWIDPGLRRQAFYTNLQPRQYRFHVIAANENGVWNRSGATLEFAIQPTFLQSVWFKLLLALCAAGLLAVAYVMRVRQVTERLQSRFDIRIAERERIARELHDTLLQGFQGLLLQFKAIANRLSESHELRQSLDAALARAQAVLIEGRDRVKELRAEGKPEVLADAILRCASELVPADGARVILTQEGSARSLHPLVQEELQRIAEEAIRNAVSHACPSTIEILLQWTRRALRMAIRDDGAGIPQSVLCEGRREGHFGLVGMRERAERTGGRFLVTSRERSGTDVVVEIPAQAAYEDYRYRLRDHFWAAWRRRWVPRVVSGGSKAMVTSGSSVPT